ncbi:catalase-domain-containing protein [Bisporella sp. PMI_857]|nr:catalase-domain-containing protein [Bisporella sp. PMI_857]
MDPREAETYRWNIFDMTKTWLYKDCPLKPPTNYLQEIEQAAFSPSTMVPRVGPSADIAKNLALQAHIFSNSHAAWYYCPGVNYQQLSPNAPISPVYNPHQSDCPGAINGSYGADPDYVGSSLKPIRHGLKDIAHDECAGRATAYTSEVTNGDPVQAHGMWNILGGTGWSAGLLNLQRSESS